MERWCNDCGCYHIDDPHGKESPLQRLVRPPDFPVCARHAAYMNRKKDATEIERQEVLLEVVACRICGCLGNESCGHKSLSEHDCTLINGLDCGCCLRVLQMIARGEITAKIAQESTAV